MKNTSGTHTQEYHLHNRGGKCLEMCIVGAYLCCTEGRKKRRKWRSSSDDEWGYSAAGWGRWLYVSLRLPPFPCVCSSGVFRRAQKKRESHSFPTKLTLSPFRVIGKKKKNIARLRLFMLTRTFRENFRTSEENCGVAIFSGRDKIGTKLGYTKWV